MSFTKPRASYSGAPLSALDAVVFDTETTGLNVHNDRIIEIGGVRIIGGNLNQQDSFVQLVNPGVPIPQGSTRIHRLTDKDVATAPDFATAFAAFSRWVGDALVLGFTLGFDLGILKAEHQRSRLKWTAPRWLDVEHLVRRVGPNLPNYALETVAAWLGVDVVDRHRALADAEITARVFLALLPRMRERGILSLAQAERASAEIAARTGAEVVGWDEKHWINNSNGRELSLIDSFPYRHRVGDVMTDKPLTCLPDISMQKALQMLMEHKVSSVFFLKENLDQRGNKKVGICTERDLLRALDQHGKAALTMPINQIGCYPLISINASEYIYRAMALMTQNRTRHLGVVDDAGKVIGAISSRDLLRQRTGDVVNLGQQIVQAQSAEELGKVWTALTPVVQSLAYEEVDVRDIAALISSELCNLTARACELALEAMREDGRGEPPCAFALMVLGSGGRGESLLAMDQDNAIVYDSPPDKEQASNAWFVELGKSIADMLNSSGVPYCKGGVMASNPAWCQNLQDWRDTVAGWIKRGSKEDMLQCDIFFDGICVQGAASLVDGLLDHARDKAAGSRTFLKFLAVKCGQFGSSINLLGRFKLTAGRLDCKLNGIMPIFSIARMLALKHRLRARSTPSRLLQAQALEANHHNSLTNLIQAHRVLLEVILHQQLRDLDTGLVLSNRVEVGRLSNYQKQEVRWALEHVEEIHNLLDIPVL